MKSKIISLRDKILCDQNIYSAIYSIDTSIVEKTLLSKSDIGQLQKLSCKVHADKQYIERIQSRLKKYLDGDELFQVEVYFKLTIHRISKYDQRFELDVHFEFSFQRNYQL